MCLTWLNKHRYFPLMFSNIPSCFFLRKMKKHHISRDVLSKNQINSIHVVIWSLILLFLKRFPIEENKSHTFNMSCIIH